MKKKLIIALLSLTLVAGIGFGYREYKLQQSYAEGESIVSRAIESTEVFRMMEEKPSETNVLKTGRFVEIDPVHKAQGGVRVIEVGDDILISFLESFESAKGPDLYVLMSSEQEFGNAIGGIDTEKTINLGRLQSLAGNQVYKISKTEWEQYNHAVTIWCKAFDIHFSHALLEEA